MNPDLPANRLDAVNQKLLKLGVREQDLVEQFIHSGGKGGQNVNKVATAVRLTLHQSLRSGAGLEVKCMTERSQYLNRIAAREMLALKLEKNLETARLFAQSEAARMRRQKAGRPKSIKRMILKDKRAKSLVKKNRSYRPGRDD
jgi:peptide chain release factor